MRLSSFQLPFFLFVPSLHIHLSLSGVVAGDAGITLFSPAARVGDALLPQLLVLLVELGVVVAVHMTVARAGDGVDGAFALLESGGGDFRGV